ncbi:hypothetical protein [Amycolatopsis sp. NPDC051061]|uniref:hypothetical protein n=1 Tax=Amycolatopsis sp. NPDC051061 TaxID=3155042 RepID=UPI00343D7952
MSWTNSLPFLPRRERGSCEQHRLLAMLTAPAGPDVDVDRRGSHSRRPGGDFGARFAAAIGAQVAPLAKPEVVIDIPDRPEELTKRSWKSL